MKTLSGTFTFKLIVLAVIGLLAGLTLRVFAQTPTPQVYVLTINGDPYVELKKGTTDDFKKLLNSFDPTGAKGSKITVMAGDGSGLETGPPFASVATSGSATSSRAASSGTALKGSVHGTQVASTESTTSTTGAKARVQVTQQVATSNAADLKKVVDSFNP